MADDKGLRKNIYLVDHEDPKIVGNKLPSNKQVLRVLFYHMRIAKQDFQKSAYIVAKEVNTFWGNAFIPTKGEQRCVKKVKELYDEWRALQKKASKLKKTPFEEKKITDFKEKLETLFDIAADGVLQSNEVSEKAKEFLINQRKRTREGYIDPVRTYTTAVDAKDKERLEIIEQRKKRAREEEEASTSRIELASSSSSSIVGEKSTASSEEEDPANISFFSTTSPSQEAEELCISMNFEESTESDKTVIMTPRLAAALDAAKVSDRRAVHIIMAVVDSLGLSTKNIIISRSSVRRFREKSRAEHAAKIREKSKVFDGKASVVHWDGKLLPALVGKDKVDRLPVIVTAEGHEIFLGAPETESGTGKDEADAVYECLDEWNLLDTVQAMCCDTTASNTGKHNGVCKLLEKSIGRDLLYLACRHHTAEIQLRAAFEVKFGKSTGPIVPFFKNFQDSWSNIDLNSCKPGVEDQIVRNALEGKIQKLLDFSMWQLKKPHCREDYREFLELVVIFLGGHPPRGISFRIPGAMHQARFMAKVIYNIKIFLFRDVYPLSPADLTACRDLCIFIVQIYIKLWFNAPIAAKAPNQDLQLLKELHAFKDQDAAISNAVLKKLSGHLWYLTPETAALAFFDEEIPVKRRNLMVQALERTVQKSHKMIKRLEPKDIKDLLSKDIEDFISERSRQFFFRFGIATSFFKQDASLWEKNPDYQKGLEIVKNLKVVNDVAERGVKLISDFNQLITRDETQKQYLLHVVQDYRKKFPDCKKSTLSGEMP